MTFLDSKGRKKTVKNCSKYLIDWRAKSLSKFQKAAKDFLRPYWKNDLVYEEFPLVGCRSRFDFYNATQRIVCEIHGNQHLGFNPFFQKTRHNFLSQVKRDLDKINYCARNNITFIEIHSEAELTEEFFASQGVIL